jgi:hypothetical protein
VSEVFEDERWDDQWAICPHCDHQHGDCWEWVKEDERQHKCDKCGKAYVAWAEYSVTYNTRKAVQP